MKKKWTKKAIRSFFHRFETQKGTVSQFCRAENISSAHFYQLKRRLETVRPRRTRAAFVEIKKNSKVFNSGFFPGKVEIHFPTGHRVTISTDSGKSQEWLSSTILRLVRD